jgi:antitoxin (DNA-binding transcriptional repressor) of toxin-antitoxin stability system
MKAVDIMEVTVADFMGRRPRKEIWVLTHRGTPVAAVVPISSGVDLEAFGLSHDPRFIEMLNRSWASYLEDGGIQFEEVRRRRSHARRTTRRRRARSGAHP